MAQPVNGKNGMIMLKKGAVLTERYIERLKNLNILEIIIEEHDYTEALTAAAALTERTAIHDQAPAAVSGITAKQRSQLYSTLNHLPDDDKLLQRSAIPMLDVPDSLIKKNETVTEEEKRCIRSHCRKQSAAQHGANRDCELHRFRYGPQPIVRIIIEADGTLAIWPYEVDLGKETKLVIKNSL